ncbi:MAG: BMP family protein [Acidimicrobiia bacterium]
MSLFAAACGGDDGGGDTSSATTAAGSASETSEAGGDGAATTAAADSDATYAIVLPSSKDDKSFSQAGYEGLMAGAEPLGVEVIFQENVQVANAQEAFRNLASQNPKVVIGLGGQFADAGAAVAAEFPDVHFVLVNGTKQGENLSSWSLAEGEIAYLGGIMAAASEAKPKKMGHVFGIEITPLIAAGNGFIDGARTVDPAIEYIDTSTGNMDDVAKAKEATSAACKAGATVILTGMNNAIVGTEQAAKEEGCLLVNNVADKCEDPAVGELYLGVSSSNTPSALEKIVTLIEAGELEPGFKKSNIEYPESFQLKLCDGDISADTQTKIDDAIEKLVAGDVTVSPVKR